MPLFVKEKIFAVALTKAKTSDNHMTLKIIGRRELLKKKRRSRAKLTIAAFHYQLVMGTRENRLKNTTGRKKKRKEET